MRSLIFFSLLLFPAVGSAQEPRNHVGVDVGPVAMIPLVMWQGNVGGSLFAGRRFSRLFSGEVVVTAARPTNSFWIGGGDPCSGTSTYAVGADVLGVRAWLHLVPDLRAIDWMAGASVRAGLVTADRKPTAMPGAPCYSPGRLERSPALVATLAMALDVRPAKWLAIRASVEAGGIVANGAGAVVAASVGPIVRF